MIITGFISQTNLPTDYKFKLDTDYYSNKDGKLYTNLYFEEENGYNEFDYNFSDLEEFIKEFKSQEKNLFKYFFNNKNICFSYLDFEVTDQEEQDGQSTYNVYREYPTIDELICDVERLTDYTFYRYEDLKELLEDDINQKNLLYYIQDIKNYITEPDAETVLYNTIQYLDIDLIGIYDFQKMYDNNELDTFLKCYTEFNDLTDDEKEYINLAVNFNSGKEKVKVV